MSDDHVMASADAAIAREMAFKVRTAIQDVWMWEDGPRRASVTVRMRQGPDVCCGYVAFGPFPKREGDSLYGHRDINALVEWIPDLLAQYVEHWDMLMPGSAFRPDKDKIIWREHPIFDKSPDGRWKFHMRLAFAPRDS